MEMIIEMVGYPEDIELEIFSSIDSKEKEMLRNITKN
jgi:hypothetical protein